TGPVSFTIGWQLETGSPGSQSGPLTPMPHRLVVPPPPFYPHNNPMRKMRLERETGPSSPTALGGWLGTQVFPALATMVFIHFLLSSITLDPNTAHPLFVVSEDKKNVKRGDMVQPLPNNPERFDATLILLGTERFSSGIHYWEVEVGDGQNWAVGVARESVKRKGPVITCPDEGIWALGLCGEEYKAFTSSDTRLTLDEAPEKIQVFVHYERGWVAFFDADYMSLIFIFRSANFCGEKICPFFKLWGLTTELRMCP
uniref:B30.2/SPRY domain-containing protein n=1 Tax=Varanus komodoensis TaxID=61221 RepID=A0A8D2LB05_VARKO